MEVIDTSTVTRKWCLTINNYTESECNFLIAYEAEYIVVGREIGEQGTPHLQCYFRLKNKKSFSKIKKEFPRANIRAANGTDAQNKKYCSKEGTILTERGTLSMQGRRSDLNGIREMIETDNGYMRAMIGSLSNLQGIRTAEKLLTYLEPARHWEMEVRWYWGESGSGKTRRATESYPDAYMAMDTNKWWEGYDGHEVVIIDDMRKEFCSYSQLLRLLDRYPYRVETKGGSRQFRARTVIITSSESPIQMYGALGEDIFQLTRRIHHTIEFSNN